MPSSDLRFGVGLLIRPSVGADAKGDMMMLQVYGGQMTPSLRSVSRAVIALHLSEGSMRAGEVSHS